MAGSMSKARGRMRARRTIGVLSAMALVVAVAAIAGCGTGEGAEALEVPDGPAPTPPHDAGEEDVIDAGRRIKPRANRPTELGETRRLKLLGSALSGSPGYVRITDAMVVSSGEPVLSVLFQQPDAVIEGIEGEAVEHGFYSAIVRYSPDWELRSHGLSRDKSGSHVFTRLAATRVDGVLALGSGSADFGAGLLRAGAAGGAWLINFSSDLKVERQSDKFQNAPQSVAVSSSGRIGLFTWTSVPGTEIDSLMLLEHDGTVLWEKESFLERELRLRVQAVGFGPDESLYVGGCSFGATKVDGEDVSVSNPVLVKVRTDGSVVWRKQYEGVDGCVRKIVASEDGAMVAALRFRWGLWQWGDSIARERNEVDRRSASLVYKFTPEGEPLYAFHADRMAHPDYLDIATGPHRQVAMVASRVKGAPTQCASRGEVYLLDEYLNLVWRRDLEPSSCEDEPSRQVWAAAVDWTFAGDILVAGNFVGTIDLGKGPVNAPTGSGFVLELAP